MITLYSLVIFVYIAARLIIPLPVSVIIKTGTAILVLLISLKHYFFLHFFGGLSSPELPRFIIIATGWLYVTLTFIFVLLVIRDIAGLILFCARYFGVFINHSIMTWQVSLGIVLLSFFCSTFGLYEAIRLPDIKKIDIPLTRLPKKLDGLTIVQLADIHVNAFNPEHKVKELVDTVNKLKPDLILLVGDMVDGSVEKRKHDIAPLKELKAKYGVFGAAGNHEYYSGYDAWQRRFADLGIHMLNNAHAVLSINDSSIVIAGITDPVADRFKKPMPNIQQALLGSPENAPKILLAHRPENANIHAENGVDLQLSGHTHGGQILGLNQIVARFNQNLLVGLYDIGNMKLYISPGISLWNGFPVRFGVPSEIPLITLRSQPVP